MPRWVANKKNRVEKIRAAKAELEAEAKATAAAKAKAQAEAEERRRARAARNRESLPPRRPTNPTPKRKRTSPIRKAGS